MSEQNRTSQRSSPRASISSANTVAPCRMRHFHLLAGSVSRVHSWRLRSTQPSRKARWLPP